MARLSLASLPIDVLHFLITNNYSGHRSPIFGGEGGDFMVVRLGLDQVTWVPFQVYASLCRFSQVELRLQC